MKVNRGLKVSAFLNWLYYSYVCSVYPIVFLFERAYFLNLIFTLAVITLSIITYAIVTC